MNAARSDRGPNIVVKPSHKVVLHVLWIEVHVVPRLGVLVVDFDRVGEPNLFECLVPVFNPLLDPSSIADWCRVLDIETYWLYWWAYLETWISLFHSPTRDVSNELFVFVITSQVGVVC